MKISHNFAVSQLDMDREIISYENHQLTASEAQACTLHLALGPDGLSCAVVQASGALWRLESRQFLQESGAEAGIQLRLSELQAENLPFAGVKINLCYPYAGLVPRRLYDPAFLPDYFKLLLPQPNGTLQYAAEELPVFDAYLLYALPQGTVNAARFFPEAEIKPLGARLLAYWEKQIDPSAAYSVMLNVRHKNAQIAVFERKHLLFYNSAVFHYTNDLLYFVMLAYEQFKISVSEAPLQISGNLLQDSDIYKALQRYLGQLQFSKLPTSFQLPEAAGSLPPHCWIDLLA